MIFRNQYVIQKEKYEHIDFKYIEVDGKVLSYEKHVPIHTSVLNNKQIIVLGWVYRIDVVTENIFDNIKSIEDLVYNLTGRFIVIYDSKIYRDFLGTYDVFFSKKLDIISSDIHFIQSDIEYTYLDDEMDDIDSVFFHMSPFIEYKNIYRLPACLCLDIRHHKIHEINFFARNIDVNYNEMLNLLYNYSNNALHNIKTENRNIVVSLSGGFDSRALLQLMLKSNIYFTVLNYKRRHHKIHDEILPELICKRLNIKINDDKIINDENTIFLYGFEWDVFHCAFKERADVHLKRYSYETMCDLFYEAFYLKNKSKNMKKNFKYYNIYLKEYLKNTNWHVLDCASYYFYLNNCVAPMFAMTDKINRNMLLLLNSYTIFGMFLKFPYMMTHNVAIDIINQNKDLKSIPINCLSIKGTKELIRTLQYTLNHLVNTWLNIKNINKRSIYNNNDQ